MKNEITKALKPLSKTEIGNLFTEVKETVLTNKQATKFTTADLWNIQRSKKIAYIR